MAHLEVSIVSHPSTSRANLIVMCILSSSSIQFLLIIYSELIQNNSSLKNNNNTRFYPTAMVIIEGRRWIRIFEAQEIIEMFLFIFYLKGRN